MNSMALLSQSALSTVPELADREFAIKRFEQAFNRAWLRKMLAQFSGCARQLQSLKCRYPNHRPISTAEHAIKLVAIAQIKGSEDRVRDFDADFNPTGEHVEQRWVNIFMVLIQGSPLPPVELIEVAGDFFVRDGHHRISVAKALGQHYIEAVITASISAYLKPR